MIRQFFDIMIVASGDKKRLLILFICLLLLLLFFYNLVQLVVYNCTYHIEAAKDYFSIVLNQLFVIF